MFPPRSGPDRELILAHAPYVRSLARRLVFDAELAKDLEQEVLLAALENAPRDPRSIKGWLSGVLRHLASKAFRSGERRAAREAARASQAVPTPDEILAREDQRRELVEHVLALDECLRNVLVLRYFEDLPPRVVARRLGIPVETVRTRTKRGVELVRARLERDGRGRGKGAWCLALVSGLKLEPPSLALAGASVAAASLPGVVAMSLSKKVAVAAVVIATASWIAFKSVMPASPRQTPVLAAPEASAVRGPSPEAPVPMPPEEARTVIPAPAIEPPTEAQAATTGSLLLTARWHDGTPAAGINARVHQTGNDFYADAFAVATSDDGTHLMEGLLPGLLSVYLDRGPAQGCEITAGERSELEFEIPRGFDISGRVVERGGRPIAGAEVFLNVMDSDWTGHVVARSDASGRFEVRSVEEGLVYLSARAPLRSPSVQLELLGSSAAVEVVELVLEPVGARIEGVVLGADGQPLSGARILVGPEDDEQWLYFEGGGRARVPAGQLVLSGDLGQFALAGVPVGRLAVQARGPGHAPWNGEVETVDQRTARLEIRLARGSTLAGRVADAEGRPVARAEVHGNGTHEFASRYARTSADGTFAMCDLPDAEFEVSVEAKGFENASATLAGGPGAELTWNPVLSSGLAIRGRLVLQGADFSQWYVICQSQDWKSSPLRADVRPSADGAFEIRGCGSAVPHSIQVHSPDTTWVYPAAERKDVLPGGPEMVIEIDPDSLPTCTLRGRIVDEGGQPQPGVNYILGRKGNNLALNQSTAQDGTFEVGPYPPGSYRVAVHEAEFASYVGEYFELAPGGTLDFGEIRLQRGGTIVARVTRDPALEQVEVTVTALQLEPARESSWMSLQDDVARSETLPAGEYVVRLRGQNAPDVVAQRTVRVTVRAGEEATAELRVESGVLLKLAWSPEDVPGAQVRLFDTSGALLCEDRLGRYDAIVIPRSAARLHARADDGRSADVTLLLPTGSAEQSVTVELK